MIASNRAIETIWLSDNAHARTHATWKATNRAQQSHELSTAALSRATASRNLSVLQYRLSIKISAFLPNKNAKRQTIRQAFCRCFSLC